MKTEEASNLSVLVVMVDLPRAITAGFDRAAAKISTSALLNRENPVVLLEVDSVFFTNGPIAFLF